MSCERLAYLEDVVVNCPPQPQSMAGVDVEVPLVAESKALTAPFLLAFTILLGPMGREQYNTQNIKR